MCDPGYLRHEGVRRRRERRRQEREFHFQRSKQKVEQVEAHREQPGRKAREAISAPTRAERSAGALRGPGCARLRREGGRERGLPERRNFARQHRLEVSCLHPERRAACVGRGEERLPVPRGLLRPPPPSPGGKERVLAAGERGAQRCAGDASPAPVVPRRNRGLGAVRGAARRHPSTAALPHSSVPAARCPLQRCPCRRLPRCEAFPARPEVSPPPGVPRSPHCPHKGTPPSTPARRSPSFMEPLARFPSPQLRVPSPMPGAFPLSCAGCSPGTSPARPRVAPSQAHPALRRAEEPSGIGRDRRRGGGC